MATVPKGRAGPKPGRAKNKPNEGKQDGIPMGNLPKLDKKVPDAEGLSSREAAEWRKLMSTVPDGFFLRVERPAVAELCRVRADLRECREYLREFGAIEQSKDGRRVQSGIALRVDSLLKEERARMKDLRLVGYRDIKKPKKEEAQPGSGKALPEGFLSGSNVVPLDLAK